MRLIKRKIFVFIIIDILGFLAVSLQFVEFFYLPLSSGRCPSGIRHYSLSVLLPAAVATAGKVVPYLLLGCAARAVSILFSTFA